MTIQETSRDYDDLTPQTVLDALDAVGFRGDGRVLQLNSYENRVFQVFLEDGAVVVSKFYRPARWSDEQILEEHALAIELFDAEVPVIPPLPLHLRDAPGVASSTSPSPAPTTALLGTPATLACQREGGVHRYAVSTRCAGREPELEAPETLRQIGRFIGRLHAVGERRPFLHRHVMRPQLDGQKARALLIDGGFLPETAQTAWDSVCVAAINHLQAAFSTLPDLKTLRLHGDCHLGNVLWRDGGPHVVDLDDACMGPAVQDLWMLVSGDWATMHGQLELLLEGYRQSHDFDRRELRLIEPLRTLRMIRHSAWLAERWSDPAFPRSFPHFGTEAYWSQQVAQLREQISAMTEIAAQ